MTVSGQKMPRLVTDRGLIGVTLETEKNPTVLNIFSLWYSAWLLKYDSRPITHACQPSFINRSASPINSESLSMTEVPHHNLSIFRAFRAEYSLSAQLNYCPCPSAQLHYWPCPPARHWWSRVYEKWIDHSFCSRVFRVIRRVGDSYSQGITQIRIQLPICSCRISSHQVSFLLLWD